jgi:Tol biopolymer transport system component/DNA-binding winged helix-turn-helix (wHTH) protein
MEPGRVVRFGVFEADLAAAELRKSGLRIKLRDQPFRILAMLLERPGEVVSREELHQLLWPEDTFVDFDHGLNAAVNRLREALGDVAGSARFIETVPRRGYRFIVPVQVIATPPQAPPESQAPTSESEAPTSQWRPANRNWRWEWLAVAVAAIGIGAAAIAVWVGRGNPLTLVAVPITSDPEQEHSPSLSPDANHVAYVRGSRAESGLREADDIYVRQIGEERELALTSDLLPKGYPVWSHDGRFIAFVRYSQGQAGIYLIPALGGAERKVGTVNSHSTDSPRVLAWHPDNQHLIVAASEAAGASGFSLSILSVNTGAVQRLTSPPKGVYGDIAPAVSPDGKWVAFARSIHERAGGVSEIHVLGLSSDFRPAGAPRQVTTENRISNGPAWTPDGNGIVFVSGTQHRRALWRVPASGGKASRLALTGENVTSPTIAYGQRRLVYVNFRSDVNVWRTSFDGDAPRQEPLLASTRLDHLPDYSTDGRRIAWISDRSGSPEIWIADADGRNPFRLTSFNALFLDHPHWSPDGGRIAFAADDDIYVIDVSSRLSRRLTDDPVLDNSPSWSPDGQWIYFQRRGPAPQIWKLAVDGATRPAQVTHFGGGAPRVSPDGKHLFYVKVHELWSVPTAGGDERRVLTDLSNTGNFVVRREGIYFIPVADRSGRSSITFLDFRTGARKTIAPVERPAMWGLAVSPDGKSILHTQLDNVNSDLMLVENFR